MSRKSWESEDKPKKETSFRPRGQRVYNQERKSSGPREFDRNSCPAGWDPDVWNLALQFEQEAAREGIQLAVGRPVLYTVLKDRCSHFREYGYKKHTRWSVDGVNVHATWQEVVSEAISRHFRNYQEDEYAADYFCGPVVFNDMIREVRSHGSNLYALRKLEEKYGSLEYDQSYATEEKS